jgi:hypothetical protein
MLEQAFSSSQDMNIICYKLNIIALNLYIKALAFNVTVFGNRTTKEVSKVQWVIRMGL